MATVSRVINNYKWVSEDLRKRVMKVVEEENYRPNYNAGVMVTGKSNMIVIVVPEIVNPFFAQFTSVISKKMKMAGYTTILIQTDNNEEEEIAFLKGPYARMADGIISITDAVEDDLLMEAIKPLRELNKPLLFIDRYLPNNIADCVINDNIGAMHRAVELLSKNGHRNVAMICGANGLTVVRDKLKGFRSAMREFHLPVNSNYIRMGDWTVRTGSLEAARLMRMRVPPTAIIACNNYICKGVMDFCDSAGLEIGKDLSLIGFEESSSDEHLFSQMGITTLKLDPEKLAAYASRYFLEKLQHNESQNYYSITESVVELSVRNSVGPVKTT